MRQLEALETVASLGLLAHNVQHGLDQLHALRVVTLGPVVARSSLSEEEVIGAEHRAIGTGTDGVHCAWLEVHEDGAGHVLARARLVEINVDPLKLNIKI